MDWPTLEDFVDVGLEEGNPVGVSQRAVVVRDAVLRDVDRHVGVLVTDEVEHVSDSLGEHLQPRGARTAKENAHIAT